MLAGAGLSTAEEAVYRLLVAEGQMSLGDLSERTELSPSVLETTLGMLISQGLAARSSPELYWAMPPDVALTPRINRQAEALDVARAAVADMVDAHRNATARLDTGHLIEFISGAEALRQHLRHIQSTVRDEMLWFCKPQYVAMPAGTNEAEFEAMARGVRYRVLYEKAYFDDEGAVGHVARAVHAGEDARAVPHLPLRLAIADRSVALCPLVPGGAAGSPVPPLAALIRDSSLVAALTALFERCWEDAVPLPVDGSGAVTESPASGGALFPPGQTTAVVARGRCGRQGDRDTDRAESAHRAAPRASHDATGRRQHTDAVGLAGSTSRMAVAVPRPARMPPSVNFAILADGGIKRGLMAVRTPRAAKRRSLTRQPRSAELVVDRHGAVARWSEAAHALLGFTASEMRGKPITDLLASHAAAGAQTEEHTASVLLRHRDGHVEACHLRVRPADDLPAGWSVALTPAAAQGSGDAVGHAVLETLFTQSPVSLCVYDSDLRLREFNPAAQGMQGVFGAHSIGLMPHEVWPDSNSDDFEVQMREVLASGVPVLGFDKRGHPPDDPEHEHVFSNSIFRLEDSQGAVLGLATTAVEITDQRMAEERIALLADASAVIGTSLDVMETGQQLADVTVPRFADAATVDLFAQVLAGEDPDTNLSGLRRVGLQYVRDVAVPAVGRRVRRPRFPYPVSAGEQIGDEPFRVDVLLPGDDGEPLYRWTSGERTVRCLVAPLKARRAVVGAVTFYRLRPGSSFSDSDCLTARDLASRAALSIDNARRYAREHNAARILQHQLLRRRTAEQTAVTTSHFFAPAAKGANWFDVIPVSGARVAFVLGETTEAGLPGAASIGRLGAAVHTLASLDLTADEVLARLDTLVTQMAGQGDTAAAEIRCVYGVYDPVSGRLSLAAAGHIPPAVAEPGGKVRTLVVPVGKPLGTADRHFDCADFDLPDGSVLAFYTPALASNGRPIRHGEAPDWLTDPMASAAETPLEDLRNTILTSSPGAEGSPGGAVLLLARTHRLDDDRVHTWDLPSDPAIVATARSLVQRQLDVWGLQETGFVTELVVSELVTNAIRYAEGPIHLRVIRDHQALICEVSDASTTAPHLRYARTGDEGGRGLFLVAQLTERWGTRFDGTGKTIWAEQDVEPQEGDALSDPHP